MAYGECASLNDLAEALKQGLSKYDKAISTIEFKYGSNRAGDVPHSQAAIQKGQIVLGYAPKYSLQSGLEEACNWYWENLK